MESGALGSYARIFYAMLLVSTKRIPSENLIAVFPQGRSKTKSASPSVKPGLGEVLAKYLKTRPEARNIKIYHETMGWGTMDDVLNTYNMVRILGYTTAHICFVSDPVHIERVRLVWDKTHPKGWTAEFFGATFHRTSFAERWIREPVARMVYRWRLFRRGVVE